MDSSALTAVISSFSNTRSTNFNFSPGLISCILSIDLRDAKSGYFFFSDSLRSKILSALYLSTSYISFSFKNSSVIFRN